ncbi:hypothetical protein [Enterococcus crotali]|nr:hypothetical protein [Enterococcus crotali]
MFDNKESRYITNEVNDKVTKCDTKKNKLDTTKITKGTRTSLG